MFELDGCSENLVLVYLDAWTQGTRTKVRSRVEEPHADLWKAAIGFSSP